VAFIRDGHSNREGCAVEKLNANDIMLNTFLNDDLDFRQIDAVRCHLATYAMAAVIYSVSTMSFWSN